MMRKTRSQDARQNLLFVSELCKQASDLIVAAVESDEVITGVEAIERALIKRGGGEDEICLFRQVFHESLFGVDVIRVFRAQETDSEETPARNRAIKQGWRVIG